jgi:hypothetical protein
LTFLDETWRFLDIGLAAGGMEAADRSIGRAAVLDRAARQRA